MSSSTDGFPRKTSTLATRPRLIALAGNPNVGKTTVFNQLTGMRQKVGNYPGVTVERKIGRVAVAEGASLEIVDVPGTYSLNPRSLDEEIAYRVLIGEMEGQERPDLIACVVDASNLERNLYLLSQVLDLGIPTVVVLNMTDAAEREGIFVDADGLSKELGVPVVPLAASRGRGVEQLKAQLSGELPPLPTLRWKMPEELGNEVTRLEVLLEQEVPGLSDMTRRADALRALVNTTASSYESHHSALFWKEVEESRRRLRDSGVLYEQVEIVARYQWITPIAERVVQLRRGENHRSISERLDSVLTHRILGPALFLLILLTVFQAVFAWATPFMDAIETGVAWLGDQAWAHLPPGLLRSLVVDGVIAGVGGIVVFLPQILLLFFFLGLLEDTGYMARVAFLMDRPMRKVGLSGRAVVPLISSYACAIPGVMATRTMDNQRDRLVTMMVAPLMTCSARLPVYALVISAFVPLGSFAIFGYQALALLSLYLLGTTTAIVAALILRRGLLKGEESSFVMELPAYHRPRMRDVLYRMFERAKLFLTRAGTIILAVSILLWFLASFPQAAPDPSTGVLEPGQQLEQSLMGRAGKAIEPALRPLGFDWKIGVGLISSFAAREVVVSALGTIYSVADQEQYAGLADAMKTDTYPDGDPVWTPLVAASLLIFFVFACQCMATLAVVKRETASWRWPLFMWAYMFILAYRSLVPGVPGRQADGMGLRCQPGHN